MAKVVTHKELAQIVDGLLLNPEALGQLAERAQYESFVDAIAQVVADHCGGEIGPIDWIETDDDPDALECSFIVRGNESLPSDGGVWKFFDSEGELDGCELPQTQPDWPEILKPQVLVELDGGLVQTVRCDRDMRVEVLDYDVEGADLDEIEMIPSLTDPEDVVEVCPSSRSPEIDPAGVARVFDALYRNDSWARLQALKVGDEAIWVDPDRGLSSGFVRIVGIESESGLIESANTMLRLTTKSGSEIEAFAHELR